MSIALEMRDIHKRFGKVEASRGAHLKVEAGTVHAVVGENGAGKSTLMKIAYGQVKPDRGEILLKGEKAPANHSPRVAISRGVGMVHQHFMLVGPLTVVENTVLGREPTEGFFLDLETPAAELRKLSERFGFELDPLACIEDLSVGEQQRVEILKVLWQGCDVLILDEPTAVLTPGEVEQLFEVLRGLVEEGVTVVLITHKLDEVASIADRITVMRRGEVVDELDGKTADPESIARAMVGRPVLLRVDKTEAKPGEPVLEVDGARATGARGVTALDGVSLEVRAGEIVGVAGVVGNGQSELVEAIAGLLPLDAGSIKLGGDELQEKPVGQRYREGLAHIPEDRHHRAVVLDFTVAENAVLGRQAEFSGRALLDQPAIAKEAERLIAESDVRPTDASVLMRGLSGGNQQKVVVGRELARAGAKLLLAGQPTRGVDIGAIELIHKQIIAARDQGWGVLLVSAELSELSALADRVLVFYRGRIVAELSAEEVNAPGGLERIGQLMTGAAIGDREEP